MDADFVKTLVQEVKSQGVFDQFRMDSLADVDTKPAYQNVRNRVETNVKDFLAKQTWTPDTNKVQLREKLRKHLLDSDILDKGAISIVDQAVNPKIATMFEPKIESIVYKYLGITPPPPPVNIPPPRPPLLPAPPMPPFASHHLNGGSMLKVETTASLLPTDLEQISPDSDRATVKSDLKEDDLPPGVDGDDQPLDDDTSPSFEPLSEDKPNEADVKDDTNNGSLHTSDYCIKELVTDSRDAGASQTSQLSQVSSDSRLTIASNESAVDAPQPINNSVESTTNITANISEEAQMPKFNENSSDTNGCENTGQELHFDIKKDAIKFEGTERKNSMSEMTPANSNGQNEISIEDAIMSEVEANIIDANNAAIAPEPEQPDPEQSKTEPLLTPHPADSSLSSFSDAQQSLQHAKTSPNPIPMPDKQENSTINGQSSPGKEEPPVNDNKGKSQIKDDAEKDEKELTPDTICKIKERPKDVTESVPEPAQNTQDIAKNLNGTEEIKKGLNKPTESTTSHVSSTSHHKKHSSRDKERRHHSDDKHRRRSRERERVHSRDKSHSKHSSSSNSKRSSSSSRHKSSKSDKSISTSSSRSSGLQETSSSKRSASSSSRSEASHKKYKSSRSEKDSHNHSSHSRSHNGSTSSSSTSKRSDRGRHRDRPKTSSATAAANQDDHNEAKHRVQKRKSHDSNDEGKSFGSGSSSSSSAPKTKENAELVSASDTNGTTNCTDGSNGTHDEVASMSSSNVIVVSDMLQQSATSFIELGSTIQINKTLENNNCELVKEQETVADMEKPVEKKEEEKEVVKESRVDRVAMEEEMEDKQQKVEKKEEDDMEKRVELEVQNDGQKRVELDDEQKQVEQEQQDDSEMQVEADDSEMRVEVDDREMQVEADDRSVEAEADDREKLEEKADNERLKENPVTSEIESNDETASCTHFEDDNDEFKSRLELIERLIEEHRNVLTVLSEDEPQALLRVRALPRSLLKRELQDAMEPNSPSTCSTSHLGSINDDSNNNSGSGADSSTSAGTLPAKRLCRSKSKPSPTPSDSSVNSKENEHNDDISKQLISVGSTTLSKLCQQQRYTNDDLYKPRPVLSQRSRRRGVDSVL